MELEVGARRRWSGSLNAATGLGEGAGNLLSIPKLRVCFLLPRFSRPAPMAEMALTAVIQEAYVQGISTRCSTTDQGDCPYL